MQYQASGMVAFVEAENSVKLRAETQGNKIWTLEPEYGTIYIAVLGFFLAIEGIKIDLNGILKSISAECFFWK